MSAAGRAVADPQLNPSVFFPVHEKEFSARNRQELRVGPRVTRVDVLDQAGAGPGPVALPQFPAVGPVIHGKKQLAVVDGQEIRTSQPGGEGGGTLGEV